MNASLQTEQTGKTNNRHVLLQKQKQSTQNNFF